MVFDRGGVQKYFDTYQQINKTPILSTGDEIKAEVSNKNCGFRLGRGPKNILILSNKLMKHQYCKLVRGRAHIT